MKLSLTKGSTSVILNIIVLDSSSTTGAWLAGLTQASSIVGGYVRMNGTGVALAVDEDVTTEGTYQAPSTAAHVRIGTPANMTAGTYELHFHNDLFLTGTDALTITLGGAANMAPLAIEVQLIDDPAAAAVTAWRAVTPTAGGVATYDDMMVAIYAAIRGQIDKTGSAYAFLDDDDLTTLFTLTLAAAQRTTS